MHDSSGVSLTASSGVGGAACESPRLPGSSHTLWPVCSHPGQCLILAITPYSKSWQRVLTYPASPLPAARNRNSLGLVRRASRRLGRGVHRRAVHRRTQFAAAAGTTRALLRLALTVGGQVCQRRGLALCLDDLTVTVLPAAWSVVHWLPASLSGRPARRIETARLTSRDWCHLVRVLSPWPIGLWASRAAS